MPSANASRKGQEKPREIVDAAEVGFLLPRVRERAEGGSGAMGGALRELLSALYSQATAWGVAPQAGIPEDPRGHSWVPGPICGDCYSWNRVA